MNKNLLLNENSYSELVKVVSANYSPLMDDATAGSLLGKIKVAQVRPAPVRPSQPAQPSAVVTERLEQLREMLVQFMEECHLENDPNSMAFVEKVLKSLQPALQKSLAGQPSTWDRMQDAPRAPKSISNPINPNPTPAHQEEMLHEPQSQRISGIDALIKTALSLADEADATSNPQYADAIAKVLPALRLMKAAQYEGFQNYWIANGRAFEMAYRNKIKADKTPHEAWFEVLEEFQASLLSSQADFISKYAKRADGDVSKFASKALMEKISEKMAGDPGVAFYEAINELASGSHAVKALVELKKIAAQVGDEKLAPMAADLETKVAGVWDSMKSMLGFGGGMGGQYTNPGSQGLDKILPYASGGPVIAEFQKIRHQWENMARPWLSGVAPHQAQVTRQEFKKYVGPMMSALQKSMDLGNKAGFHLQVPQLPSVEKAGMQTIVNKDDLSRFTQEMFQDIKPFMDDQLANAIQQKTQQKPNPQDVKNDKAQKTKDWWRSKQNTGVPIPQSAALPPAAPAPAHFGKGWESFDSKLPKRSPAPAPRPAAAPSSRLAPHEIAALKKVLPPEIRAKFMQHIGMGAPVMASWVRGKTAQIKNDFMNQAPQTVVQPPATPEAGGGSEAKIKAALEDFFAKEYPNAGFAMKPYIEKLMNDVKPHLKQEDPLALQDSKTPLAPAGAPAPQAQSATPGAPPAIQTPALSGPTVPTAEENALKGPVADPIAESAKALTAPPPPVPAPAPIQPSEAPAAPQPGMMQPMAPGDAAPMAPGVPKSRLKRTR